MRGIKVQGHASMVRSGSCPGLIVCVDNNAGEAALRARQNAEEREGVVVSQQAQIENLQLTIKLMAEKLGIDIPLGEENDNAE